MQQPEKLNNSNPISREIGVHNGGETLASISSNYSALRGKLLYMQFFSANSVPIFIGFVQYVIDRYAFCAHSNNPSLLSFSSQGSQG